MIKSICFLATYKCNAQCDYCECGPRVSERLRLQDMVHYMDEGLKLGTIGQVIFSGGEPTLLGKDLFTAIRYANEHGLLTRIVTNGWWGRTVPKALVYLDRLIECGLTEMNISVDDLHQRWILPERVKNVFLAAQERQFPCLIAHKAMNNYAITKESLERFFGVELIEYDENEKYGKSEDCRLFSSGGVVPVGRQPENPPRPEDIAYTPCTANCSSILKDIIIGADHNLLACCGIVSKGLPELTLGDLRHHRLIDLIDKANHDLVLNWIALEGPASIAQFVREKDPTVKFNTRYVGTCHLCNEVLTRPDVRRVLAEHLDEVSGRIQLHRAFLETVRGDKKLVGMYCH